MKFLCPHCQHPLAAEPEMVGQTVRCPVCDSRILIPAEAAPVGSEPSTTPVSAQPKAGGKLSAPGRRPPASPVTALGQASSPQSVTPGAPAERQTWKEADPTNPSILASFGIGFGLLFVWYAIFFPFNPPEDKAIADYSGMQFVASLFYKHFLVSVLNTFFFTWAIGILFLKHLKLRHQKSALLLDVLPMQLGKEINADNVGLFIDNLYKLPVRLRDSMMVNRIRKGLELFEIRPNTNDVREMMASQSEIDGARIGGSFTLLRAFLWAIPLLGFIGTVIGLSHAIGGMNFANVEDVQKIVGSINKVTSGLGTAFDATLLGLVLAMTLNFPLNSLSKQEDDNLNAIDAFCIEVLIPRLKDSSGQGDGDPAAVAEAVAKSMSKTQDQFLRDLNELSKRMNEYASSLDVRMDAFQKTVTETLVAKTTAAQEEMKTRADAALKSSVEKTDVALNESMAKVAKYIGGLEEGINGLNSVLKDLGAKQVVIQAPKKSGWFSRG